MTVLCPRHTIVLTIVKRNLPIGENIYPAIIGRCPKCEAAYVNRIFFRDKCATIEGETYEFLQEMYLAFPPEPIVKKNIENTARSAKQNEQPKSAEKNIDKKSQKSPSKAKKVRNDDPTITYVQNISVKKPRCPDCNALLSRKRVTLDILGMSIVQTVHWCSKCNSAYMTYARRAALRRKVKNILENIRPFQNTAKSKSTSKLPHDIEGKSMPNSKVEVFHPSHILQKLPLLSGFDSKCTFCDAPMQNVNVKYNLFGESNTPAPRYTNAWSCTHCKAVFLDKTQLKLVQKYKGKYRIYTIEPMDYANATEMMADTKKTPAGILPSYNPCTLPYEKDHTKNVNLSATGNAVWIYANKCRCLHCERIYQRKTVVNKTAVVDAVTCNNISIDIMFCMGCGKYFVNIATLEAKEKAYGILLFERRFADELLKNNTYGFDFAPDSILSRCGYSVRDGIPQSHRRAILRYVIEVVGVGKAEIEEKINMFLHFHRRIKGHEESCQRWEDDLLFLHNYNIKFQEKVYSPKFLQSKK